MKRFITLLTVLLLSVALAQDTRTVTVTGVGQAFSAPDAARIYVGVSVELTDIDEVMTQLDARIADVKAVIEGFGIDTANIQTTYFNLWQSQNWEEGEPTTTFYASHSLTVYVEDADLVSGLIGEMVDAGANSINNVEFVISDNAALKSEARAKAMEQARATASELAELADAQLGSVVSVKEANGGFMNYETGMMSMGAGGVEPGTLGVTVSLEVVFELE